MILPFSVEVEVTITSLFNFLLSLTFLRAKTVHLSKNPDQIINFPLVLSSAGKERVICMLQASCNFRMNSCTLVRHGENGGCSVWQPCQVFSVPHSSNHIRCWWQNNAMPYSRREGIIEDYSKTDENKMRPPTAMMRSPM